MQNLSRYVSRFVLLGALAGAVPMLAQEVALEGPVETHATVSVEAKQPVRLNPSMLKVEVNGHQTQLTGLTQINSSSAQIAILIDDGLRSSFGNQIGDLQKLADFGNSIGVVPEKLDVTKVLQKF